MYWIKVPGPGEFRGEGTWCKVEDISSITLEDWKFCNQTNYLPTYFGETPPNIENGHD